jgi:hypothetical protein
MLQARFVHCTLPFLVDLVYHILIDALAPCHWFLLLGRMGVAFIERRLSLLILFFIFYALSYFSLGSTWGPCRWRLLLGRKGAVFIERRLSLSILFIIFD